MKKYSSKFVSIVLIAVMCISLAACSDKKPTASSTPSSETTEATTTTTEATTTLTEYSGPLPSSDVSKSWEETDLAEQVTMYATVSAGNYLRVRSGPDTSYDIMGTLTRGQAITVVAKTGNGWYRTSDGFYISSKFISSTQP